MNKKGMVPIFMKLSLGEKMTLNKYYIIVHNYEKCSEGCIIYIIERLKKNRKEDSKLDHEETYLS